MIMTVRYIRDKKEPAVLLSINEHSFVMTSDQASRLAADLHEAFSEADRVESYGEAHTIAECIDRPGVELIVHFAATNNDAYTRRLQLERDGFKCRTMKVYEGKHAVYATWPVAAP